ncbi:hypothetical protein ARMSODRAFT_969057 [Armillaria solidipes]|uniref:Uncharacterized protein n=1 Tax=Armillaria solidipes TaxID=1076256 RepID=A0A2H3BZR1_9AGAR|nr:hypothetical protein ARMSODRAFT_969057 [Armillaria solidipes]
MGGSSPTFACLKTKPLPPDEDKPSDAGEIRSDQDPWSHLPVSKDLKKFPWVVELLGSAVAMPSNIKQATQLIREVEQSKHLTRVKEGKWDLLGGKCFEHKQHQEIGDINLPSWEFMQDIMNWLQFMVLSLHSLTCPEDANQILSPLLQEHRYLITTKENAAMIKGWVNIAFLVAGVPFRPGFLEPRLNDAFGSEALCAQYIWRATGMA